MLISAPLEHLHSGIIFSIVPCLNLLLHLFYDLAKHMYEKPILELLSNNNCVLGTSPSVWCECFCGDDNNGAWGFNYKYRWSIESDGLLKVSF